MSKKRVDRIQDSQGGVAYIKREKDKIVIFHVTESPLVNAYLNKMKKTDAECQKKTIIEH